MTDQSTEQPADKPITVSTTLLQHPAAYTLKAALPILKKLTSAKSCLPATTHVRIDCKAGSSTTLTATDLATSVTVEVAAQTTNEGACLVPFGVLASFATSANVVDIDVTGNKATLVSATSKTSAHTLDIDVFPSCAPEEEFSTVAVVEAEPFMLALSRVLLTAARDDLRPVLTGVECRFEGNTASLTATDGVRLTTRSMECLVEGDGRVVLIPATSLKHLVSIKPTGVLEIGRDDKGEAVQIKGAGFRLVARLINANYPNWKQIVPDKFSGEFAIDTKQVLSFAKAAKTAKAKALRMRLVNGEEKTLDCSYTDEIGNESAARFRVTNVKTFGAHETLVSFNPAYIVEALTGDKRTMTTFQLGRVDKNAEFVHSACIVADVVLMPMHESTWR